MNARKHMNIKIIILLTLSLIIGKSLHCYTYIIQNETGEPISFRMFFAPTGGEVYDDIAVGASRTLPHTSEGVDKLIVILRGNVVQSRDNYGQISAEIKPAKPYGNYLFTVTHKNWTTFQNRRNADSNQTITRKAGGNLEIQIQAIEPTRRQ